MQTADSLKKIFDCKDDAELGELFGRTGGAVSVWRKKGLPAAIEKKAYEIMRERGIEVAHDQSAIPKFDPEDEKLLGILKSMPRAREAMEAFLALPERKQKIHLGKMLESLEEMEGEEKK